MESGGGGRWCIPAAHPPKQIRACVCVALRSRKAFIGPAINRLEHPACRDRFSDTELSEGDRYRGPFAREFRSVSRPSKQRGCVGWVLSVRTSAIARPHVVWGGRPPSKCDFPIKGAVVVAAKAGRDFATQEEEEEAAWEGEHLEVLNMSEININYYNVDEC